MALRRYKIKSSGNKHYFRQIIALYGCFIVLFIYIKNDPLSFNQPFCHSGMTQSANGLNRLSLRPPFIPFFTWPHLSEDPNLHSISPTLFSSSRPFWLWLEFWFWFWFWFWLWLWLWLWLLIFVVVVLTWVLTLRRHHLRRGKSVFQGEPQGCGEKVR